MASRLLHVSKTNRPREQDDESERRPTETSKRSSFISTSSSASKIPTYSSSIFSRSKGKRTDDKSSVTSATSSQPQSSIGAERKDARPAPTGLARTPKIVAKSPNFGTQPQPVRTAPSSQSPLIPSAPTPRNRLRRKASSNDQRGQYAGSKSSVSEHGPKPTPAIVETVSSPGGYSDPFPGSILGITLPAVSNSTSHLGLQYRPIEYATSSSRMASYTPKQPKRLSTQDLPPPTPNFTANSSSSSTRYSESPGPFSRTSTPTSLSSQSPGITQPTKFTSRLQQPLSPTNSRPPVTRRRLVGIGQHEPTIQTQGLPPLEESLASSSSSSTVKGKDYGKRTTPVPELRLQAPAPTPPLRLSSRRLPSTRSIPKSTTVPGESRTIAESTITRTTPKLQQPQVFGQRNQAGYHDRFKGPPPRPSREGTPRLDQEPSPIIQSNLSHLETTGHKRRESIEKATLALASPPLSAGASSSRPALTRSSSSASRTAKLQSTLPSPAPARTNSPHLYPQAKPAPTSRELPTLLTDTRATRSKREPSPTKENLSSSSSRFGFFSRRAKSPAIVDPPSAGERPIKKGPAAGTGHEGYGKYARRGRSGSTSTAASRGRSISTDRSSISAARPASSRKSSFASEIKPELDEFYKDRLEPVVIGGGGIIKENRNSGVGIYRTTSAETNSTLSLSNDFKPELSASPVGYRFPDKYSSTEASSTASSVRVSTESVSSIMTSAPTGKTPGRPTLAHRRSLHRSQLFKQAEPLRIPPPINTQALGSPVMLDSHDTTHSAIPQTDSSLNLTDDLSEGHEGNWLKPKKTHERARFPRKWNFFHRSQTSPKKSVASMEPELAVDTEELPAEITTFLEPRPIAHYAMLDGYEQEGSDTLEDLLREVEENLELRRQGEASNAIKSAPRTVESPRKYSMLLPSPPQLPVEFSPLRRPSSPQVPLQQQPQLPIANSEASLRTSSPDVPKKRLQQVGRIPKVVSKRDRPHKFAPQSFSRPFNRSPVVTKEPTSLLPSLPERSVPSEYTLRSTQTEPLPSARWAGYEPARASRTPPVNGMLYNLDGEKEFLAFSRKGSEVSGSSSSGVLSFVPVTAGFPSPGTVLSEDEMWNEYDELLDRVAVPVTLPGRSMGTDAMLNSFPNVQFAHDSRDFASPRPKKESPIITADRNSGSTALVGSPRQEYNRLNTLDLPSPQRSSVNPSTPFSLSDLYAGYGDRSSVGPPISRQSLSSGSHYSVRSSGSRSSNSSEYGKRYTQVMQDKTKAPLGTSESLRFSALMTSRWLSFDRVLFSPVSEEIRNNKQDRVLVIDGLGNDDWSSYCAFAYPDASIYNLGIAGIWSGKDRQRDSWQPPSNHRQFNHTSFSSPFPFPKGFFTAVVFRFPVLSSEVAYRNAISECKRVLRPGGYLELTILDMDMVNMGNRARRAIRGLKVKVQVAEPEVSLSPTSDTIQKLLGRRGFENLNRCVVGIPVAGVISDSRAGSLDEGDTNLGNMLQNPSAQKDIPITQMVPKVGRWWWSRCYERNVLVENDVDNSIWTDKALLKECEKRDTGFRLMICYAQKPVNARRRTVSV